MHIGGDVGARPKGGVSAAMECMPKVFHGLSFLITKATAIIPTPIAANTIDNVCALMDSATMSKPCSSLA